MGTPTKVKLETSCYNMDQVMELVYSSFLINEPRHKTVWYTNYQHFSEILLVCNIMHYVFCQITQCQVWYIGYHNNGYAKIYLNGYSNTYKFCLKENSCLNKKKTIIFRFNQWHIPNYIHTSGIILKLIITLTNV